MSCLVSSRLDLLILSCLALPNLIAMHAGKVLLHLCAGKHGGSYKEKFISLKAVLIFQTLMLATLGKWATTHDRVFSWARTALGLCCLDRPKLQTPITQLPLISVALEVREHILLL